jgi:hypothetical protein
MTELHLSNYAKSMENPRATKTVKSEVARDFALLEVSTGTGVASTAIGLLTTLEVSMAG